MECGLLLAVVVTRREGCVLGREGFVNVWAEGERSFYKLKCGRLAVGCYRRKSDGITP